MFYYMNENKDFWSNKTGWTEFIDEATPFEFVEICQNNPPMNAIGVFISFDIEEI